MANQDDKSKILAKIVFAVVKAVPSILIDVELARQEKLAQEEQRLNDLELIRFAMTIKQEIDTALDKSIVRL